jgi:hypothetical protein
MLFNIATGSLKLEQRYSLNETRVHVVRIWMKWHTINSFGGLQTGIHDQSNLRFTISTPYKLTTMFRMRLVGLNLMSRFFG